MTLGSWEEKTSWLRICRLLLSWALSVCNFCGFDLLLEGHWMVWIGRVYWWDTCLWRIKVLGRSKPFNGMGVINRIPQTHIQTKTGKSEAQNLSTLAFWLCSFCLYVSLWGSIDHPYPIERFWSAKHFDSKLISISPIYSTNPNHSMEW